MKSCGKSRREISDAIGVSYYTFTDWVKGKKYPRMDRVEQLANYFGIRKSDLIEQQKEKPVENDGLSESQKALIAFAWTVPEEKAEKVLHLLQAILEADL
jgi:transcriptional regulator with XRE-family HTH domain